MRMRLKKHLDERLDACKDILIAREVEDFYKLKPEERKFTVDTAQIFEQPNNALVLEIGCGKGAWAIESAQRHPDKNYLAVEKLSNVIVAACEQALPHRLPNLKFVNCRAENLDCFLPRKCVNEIALNFSCPFPKKTYANRRLTSARYLQLYKDLLADDGVILQKTDDKTFFEWSIDSLRENGYQVYDICYDLPEGGDNVVTEYERKFRAQYLPIYALKAQPNK